MKMMKTIGKSFSGPWARMQFSTASVNAGKTEEQGLSNFHSVYLRELERIREEKYIFCLFF
jgi:hypothetical protein